MVRRLAVLGLCLMAGLPPASGAAPAPSAFARESAMSPRDLVERWSPFVKEASRRFAMPESWIRAVMTVESGGRTMLVEGQPITSNAGAMGLMQLMPQTWQTMRAQYALGNDPYDPHDNIMAGVAYLALLYRQYKYPEMFAAYNDGPAGLDGHKLAGEDLPPETTDYVLDIASILRTGVRRPPGAAGNMDWLLKPEPADVMTEVAPVVPVHRAYPADNEDDDGD